MSLQKLPIEQSALLVVDIQDSFKVGPRWERRSNPDFERNVERLLESYRAAGLPVLFFLHTDPDPGFETTSPHFKLMDFLAPRADEPTLVKTSRNCFTSTNLREILESRGVRRLAVTGITMETCCETTTRVAGDLGYDVDFVIDAMRTFPITDRETGEEISTDEIARRTRFVLHNRFARVTATEELLRELVPELEAVAVPCSA